jgi:hypothetical protein
LKTHIFCLILVLSVGPLAHACYEPDVARKAVRAIMQIEKTPMDFYFLGKD